MSTWQWLLLAWSSLLLGFVFGCWFATSVAQRKLQDHLAMRELADSVRRSNDMLADTVPGRMS